MKTTGNSRPFGVSLIVAGIDRVLGPQLYVLDSEGSLNAWNAVCIGKKSEKVMEDLVEYFPLTTENFLCVADVLPRFQECLRKHFPSKLMTSAEIVAERIDKEKINESMLLDDKVDDFRGIGSSREHSFLPETLLTERSKGRDSTGSEEDPESIEYWDFEVTSIMLNSEGDICLLPMKSEVS